MIIGLFNFGTVNQVCKCVYSDLTVGYEVSVYLTQKTVTQTSFMSPQCQNNERPPYLYSHDDSRPNCSYTDLDLWTDRLIYLRGSRWRQTSEKAN